MSEPYVVLAGATGNQGGRTAAALVESGAGVRALVRPGANAAGLQALGVDVVPVDMDDVTALAAACKGATCVVSTLGGLRDVILERQSLLLDAAVAADVSRFISSDYSADYTKTQPGGNRNFDLRREFMGRADRAQIATTSIFNGAFLDMLGAEMPIIQPRIRRVLYWGDRYQPLDFTTRDDAPSTRQGGGRRLSTADSAHRRRHRERLRHRRHDERGHRPELPAAARRRPALPRGTDPRHADPRATASRGVPDLARHAVHARPVQRRRQTHPPGQRPLPGTRMDIAEDPARTALQHQPAHARLTTLAHAPDTTGSSRPRPGRRPP